MHPQPRERQQPVVPNAQSHVHALAREGTIEKVSFERHLANRALGPEPGEKVDTKEEI